MARKLSSGDGACSSWRACGDTVGAGGDGVCSSSCFPGKGTSGDDEDIMRSSAPFSGKEAAGDAVLRDGEPQTKVLHGYLDTPFSRGQVWYVNNKIKASLTTTDKAPHMLRHIL